VRVLARLSGRAAAIFAPRNAAINRASRQFAALATTDASPLRAVFFASGGAPLSGIVCRGSAETTAAPDESREASRREGPR
jgi:hypothetical protein